MLELARGGADLELELELVLYSLTSALRVLSGSNPAACKPGIVSLQALHDGKHEIPNAQSEHYVGPEMCGHLQYGQDCEDGNDSEHQDLLLLEEVPNGTPSHLVERHCGL